MVLELLAGAGLAGREGCCEEARVRAAPNQVALAIVDGTARDDAADGPDCAVAWLWVAVGLD